MDEIPYNIRDFVAVIRRQYRLILLTAGVIVGVALIYVLSATPLYRAETLILVDPAEQNLLDSSQSSSFSNSSLNARVGSEVEILRSAAMSLAVVNDANLITDPEFGPSLSTKQRLLQAIGLRDSSPADGKALLQGVLTRFSKATDVKRLGLTYIISVGVTTEDPERSARLANEMASSYIERQIAAKVGGSLSSRDVLQERVATAQSALALSEEQLDSFIFDNLDRLEAESGDAAIAALRAAISAAQDTRLQSKITAQTAQSYLTSQDWEGLSNSLQDTALQALADQRSALEQRLGQVAADTPLALNLRASLETLEQNLERRASLQLGNLQDQVAQSDENIDGFRNDIRQTLLSSELSSETLAEIYALQQGAEQSRRQYQILLSRLADLETQAGIQVADSRVVSEALPPLNPTSPNVRLILAIALMTAMGIGTALAFANEFYIGGVTSVEQLSNILQAPVAAAIPNESQEADHLSIADAIVEQPLSAYGEAFRQLRASIDQELRLIVESDEADGDKQQAKVILVTSSIPVEGKSTSSLALARTYAMSGKKTLLIDADLRKPSLARQLGLKPTSGFMDFLTTPVGEQTDTSFFTKDPKSSLQMFLGSGRSDIPTDQLLVSERFSTLLRHSKERVDIIIIDSPPLVPVVDARYIAHQADLILMVSRFASTTQSDIRQSIGQLRDVVNETTPILGVLSYEERVGSSQKYQGYYHDYVS